MRKSATSVREIWCDVWQSSQTGSWCFAFVFDDPWMQKLVAEDGPAILRCKGILSFKDDEERFVLQGVHMILDGDHQRPWREDESRDSRIVFIGRNLSEDKIRQGFESCIA